MNRILIVDDEEDICAILKYNLEKAGFYAETAVSAESATSMDISSFDLILLDVMMTGMSGFDFASALKQNKSTVNIPIIFVTAKDSIDDKVTGLEIGADDYISKPFSVKEVISRVKAVLRRTQSSSKEVVIDNLRLNTENKSLYIDGEQVILTKTEFEILHLLISNRGKVFSREEILEKVWDDEAYVTTRVIDVNITRLRRKIGSYGNSIITRHGFGYCYE